MANEPSVPRPGHGHPRSRLAFLAVAAGLSALITLASAFSMGAYFWARAQIVVIPEESRSPGSTEPPAFVDDPCTKRPCNYLLLGSDSRAGLSESEQEQFGTNQDIGGSQRSDTIIVVHTDPAQERAVLLSFPRDLWVEIPGHGYGKINSAFEGGIEGNGAQLVARTIKGLTGLQINHVMYVDLAGFEGVVEALGGVEMCVPYPMSDPLTGLDIPAGCQHFDGKTALAFVRTRHQPCDKIPDFARIARQQQFLRAVLAKLLSPGELVHFASIVPEILRNIVVDEGLRDPAQLAYLASRLNGVNTGAADFRSVPTTTASIYPNGVYTSIVELVEPQAGELFERIREGKPLGDLGKELPLTPPSPATIAATVYDRASGGTAAQVLDVLTGGGFDTALGLQDAGALSSQVKGSVILYKRGERAMADVVQGYLSNLDVVQAPRGLLADVDVAVVVTSRYILPPPPATVSCP